MNWASQDLREVIQAIGRGEVPPSAEVDEVGDRLVSQLMAMPVEDALATAAMAPDWNNPVEGLDYRVEAGLLVFTSWYHLRRGYCCGNGCRHCPYPDSHKA